MKITDVENLSAGELKAKRSEIVKAIKPTEEIVERWVKARADAKMRDEKLSEQGKTITILQESHDAGKAKISELEKQLAKSQKLVAEAAQTQATQADNATKRINELVSQIAKLDSELQQANERADRLKAQAEQYAAALSTMEKAAKDARAFEVIETADKGE